MGEPFDMTPEGYRAALEWCASNDIDLESIKQKELSVDGYTVVRLVNDLRRVYDV